ncbi:MAG: pitrilysin family protein [Ignavibacteriaceae bacterium]
MQILERSQKPGANGEIKFSLPEIQEFRLNNSLNVLFVQKDELPIVRFNLITNSGGKYDTANKKGLANLFSRVLDEGAGKYNAIELSDEFDSLGTNFNINCFNDNIHISLQTLAENLDKSLELFATVLISPHLDKKSFDREKRKVITALQQLKDSPDEIADIAFDHIVFGKNNPYAHPVIGYPDGLENISTEDISSFYKERLGPADSTLIVVGNINREILEEKLNNYFSDWKSNSSNPQLSFPSTSSGPNIYFVHKEGSVQSEIRIGHIAEKRSKGNFFPKHMMNIILGGQFSSRINLNLREDKGYTYGAHSRFNYLKEAAQFIVSTSVGSENTGNAINEIIRELDEIKKGIKKEELAFAKSSVTLRFPGNFETYGQIAGNLISLVLHSLPRNYFSTYLDSINNVNEEQITRAAVENIHTDKLSVLVAGDKKLFLEQLEGLEISEIIELDIWGNPVL